MKTRTSMIKTCSNFNFQALSIIISTCGWNKVNTLLELSMTNAINKLPVQNNRDVLLGNDIDPNNCVDFIIAEWEQFEENTTRLLKACGTDRNKGQYIQQYLTKIISNLTKPFTGPQNMHAINYIRM